MSPTLLIAILFLLVSCALFLAGSFRPLLALIAVREAVRRPGQSLLVVTGLMVATAAITAALVGADSSEDSSVANARRAWGATDLTLRSQTGGYFSPLAAQSIASDTRVRTLIDGVQQGVEAVGSVGDLDRRQGEPAVRLIGFDPTSQRSFGAYVLSDGQRTYGEQLRPGQVFISRRLAAALKAKTGDRLRMTVEQAQQTVPMQLEVAGIARAQGPGAYGLRQAVFAPLTTAQALVGSQFINTIRVSGTGDAASSLKAAKKATPEIQQIVNELVQNPFSGVSPLQVREVKAAAIQRARDETKFSRAMLLGMSALIVAAGGALAVNLAMMLAADRRRQMGILRALGLSRLGLATTFVLEGFLYSVVAAAVGTVVGIAAGRIVAGGYARAFAQFAGAEVDFVFFFSLRPATIAVGFVSGALITLSVLFTAALKTSQVSITSAIRNLVDPAMKLEGGREWRRRLRNAALFLGGSIGLSLGDETGRLLGGVALIIAGASISRGLVVERVHSSVAGLVLAGWAFGMVRAIQGESDPNKFFMVFTMAVLISVFGLCIFASANLRVLEKGLTLLGGAAPRLRATLRPPFAYLTRRPLATGLTTGMFAVVLAIITLLASFMFIFRPRYERDSVGYDLRVTSTGKTDIVLPASTSQHILRQSSILTRGYVGPVQASFGSSESIFMPLFELSEEQLGAPPIRLAQRYSRFTSDAAVWDVVRKNPRWVVATFGAVGEYITLRGSAGPVKLRVAANPTPILSGVAASSRALEPFNAAARGATLLVDVDDSIAPSSVARSIEEALFADGVDAITTKSILDELYRANVSFFSVAEVLMRLGLVVGVLSLGILGLRAIVERRQIIGVLRAIGYRAGDIMAGLVAEAAMTATLGVVVGFSAGILMAYFFLKQFAQDSPFGVDLARIAAALVLVYVAVFFATVWPAWRASKLMPADAVRYPE